MKILIIRCYPSYLAVTGSTYNIQELGLAKAFVRSGHTCDILFWTEKKEETVCVPVDDAGVVRVFYRHGINILKNAIYSKCDELFEQYDVLHTNEYNQMQSWILAGKYPQKTVIYHGPYYCPFNTRYNLMCKVFDTFFLRRYLCLETKFITKSLLAKEFLTSKGIKEENVVVAGVGLDTGALTCKEPPHDLPLYQQMKNDDRDVKLLYIGRIEKRRNIPFLIEVLYELKKRKENVKLYMIGDGDSDCVQQFLMYVEQKSVADSVVWQKSMPQNQLEAIYRMADFFLLPTEYEIFGMVLLEAMYHGVVTITTRNGGSDTLIRHGENGIIASIDNAKTWADCILNLNVNKKAMQHIQLSAKKTIKEGFLWDTLRGKFEAVYNSILQGS